MTQREARGPLSESARGIREMFSSIAGAYDLLNRLLSLRRDVAWRRKAIGQLPPRERALLLDVCGGTGDLGLEALRQQVAQRVLLADFAEPMVRHAASKGSGDERWHVCVADGLTLPLPDTSVDAITCAFGVRNLTDLERAAQEFARVLRPNGELLVLEFMGGQRGLMYLLFRFYFRRVLPLIGRLISGHGRAYAYLPESVSRFVSTKEWLALLERHGFQALHATDCTFGIATITLARKAG